MINDSGEEKELVRFLVGDILVRQFLSVGAGSVEFPIGTRVSINLAKWKSLTERTESPNKV